MKRMNGAQAFVRMLQLHGVQYIFGLCGDTSLPFYDALYQLDHGMKHILVRDERSAGYMADGYARVSNRVGVCEGPSGGGATYILPGLAEANESSIPILAINSDISVSSRGKFALTELDQQALFHPVTKWNTTLDQAEQIPSAIRTAFQQMTTGRPGATHIVLPFDVQKNEIDEQDVWADSSLQSYPAWRAAANPHHIEKAVALINASERPLIICGGGPIISGAFEEVQQLGELIGAPVANSISGHGIISSKHPLALGVIGSNGGTIETKTVVQAADLVIFIGCRAGSVTTERWQYPNSDCKIVHIDIDPAVIGRNFNTDAAILGDAKLALDALCHSVQNQGANRLKTVESKVLKAKTSKFNKFRELAEMDSQPIKPERVVHILQEILPSDAVIVADAGTPCPYFSAFYQLEKPGRFFITNRAHGALGYSLPAAMGAYYGKPGSKCVAVMGDGSFGFNVGELETLVRLKIPITLIVLSNSAFGWIKAGQKYQFGERYFSVDFTPTDHCKVAEAYGLKAWRVEDPMQLKSALIQAIEAEGPTLVDVICQPLHEAQAPVSAWIA